MSEAQPDRVAIQRQARRMAERMGLRRPEEKDAATLPTENVFVLRGLLHTNKLTPEQAATARQYLAEVARDARQNPTPPDVQLPGGDAA